MNKLTPITFSNKDVNQRFSVFKALETFKLESLKNKIQNKPEDFLPLPHSNYFKAFQYLLSALFDNLEGSPKYESLWNSIYVFANKDNIYEKEGYTLLDNENLTIPINSSKALLDKFIKELVNKSLDLKTNLDNEYTPRIGLFKNSRLILSGDPGSGKTAIQNYILSSYSNFFKEKGCVVIRIDLTKIRNTKSLQYGINQQTCKIFLRKYFKELKSTTDKINFLNEVGFYKDEINVIERIESFLKRYVETNGDIVYPEDIVIPTVNYVQREYGFICFIDGFDKIHERDNGHFQYLEALDIINNEHSKGVYIFVMRYYSYSNFNTFLLKKEESYKNSARKYLCSSKFVLEDISLFDLFHNRLKYISSNYENLLKNTPNDILDQITDHADKIAGLIQKFNWLSEDDNIMKFNALLQKYFHHGLNGGYEEISGENFFQNLSNLFGLNYRNLFEIYLITSKTFLQLAERYLSGNSAVILEKIITEPASGDLNKIFSRHYRLLPNLCDPNNLTYIHPYEYKLLSSKKNKLESSSISLNGAHVSRRFFYNIFYSINDTAKNISFKTYGFSIRLRILQFLKINSPKTYQREELINKVNELFKFKKNQIKIALSELENWDLITYSIGTKETSSYAGLIISKLGNQFVEKIIFNFSYYRFIVDDLLLPKSFLDMLPIFEINFESSYDGGKKTAVWALRVLKKVIYVTAFLDLLLDMELEELSKEDSDLSLGDYKINITGSLYDTVFRIVNTSFSNDKNKCEKFLLQLGYSKVE